MLIEVLCCSLNVKILRKMYVCVLRKLVKWIGVVDVDEC